MTRRELREKVFKILFCLEFNSEEDMKEQIELALDGDIPADDDEPFEYLELRDEDKKYISCRVLDIVDKHKEIDGIIEEISEGWKLPRIGKAELAILRLAIYEMKYDEDIPVKVAINEAVELSKLYCDTEAKSFINALLAKLTK
ncbi:MAG: transcription antitermination factor NusB [Coprococcus sp.]